MSPAAYITFEIAYGIGGQETITLIQGGPPDLADKAQPACLPNPILPLSSWPPPDPVQNYGKALSKCLNDISEVTVKKAIEYALNSDSTVYLKLKSPDWESQAWEALWDDTDFFLLRSQRGMARMVDQRVRSLSILPLERPVRIMAVLSASGLSSIPQWEAIYRAATNNATAIGGLPVWLHVLTGEEALADRIRELPPRDKRLTVTVANIDRGRGQTVSGEIKRFRPHILHFFCHGQVLQGAGVLRLSDIDQHHQSMSKPPPPEGTVTSFAMDYKAFREIIELASLQGWLWLTVLNACKLGATSARVAALTQKFVLAGVPAAIGMTEEIDENDASEFCDAFYSSLLLELANTATALEQADECALDWAKLLHGARISISDRRRPATCNPQWTFPVMYVGGYEFKFKKDSRTSLAHDMRDGAIQQLRNAPPEVLTTIANVEVT